ncbi:MAG: lysylphosphatidylglycerol synthase transmembrane domain-containing protein, partial [Candidatus Aenigmatarchaeota archaeon]
MEFRKIKIPILKILISILLLGVLISSIDMDQLKIHLGSVDPLGFTLITALFLVSVIISSYRWMKFLHAVDLPVNFYDANALSFIGRFFNNFLPTSFGGDALKIFYLFKNEGKVMIPLISVLYDRIVGFLSMMALGILGLIMIRSQIGIPISVFSTLYIYGGLALFLVYLTFWYGGSIWSAFSNICLRSRNNFIIKRIYPFLSDLSQIRPSKKLSPFLFIISFIGNFLSIYTVYLLSR